MEKAEALAQLVRQYRHLQRDAALAAGLSPFAAEVLEQVGRMESPGLGDLAGALALDPSWVSRGVQTLVERGLLRRQPQPQDRRAVQISLTAEGRRFWHTLSALMAERVAAMIVQAESGAGDWWHTGGALPLAGAPATRISTTPQRERAAGKKPAKAAGASVLPRPRAVPPKPASNPRRSYEEKLPPSLL